MTLLFMASRQPWLLVRSRERDTSGTPGLQDERIQNLVVQSHRDLTNDFYLLDV